MAAAGHTDTGVDPARASLEAARAKPGADSVTWVEGTSPILPDAAFEVAVMTSHVAQFFVDDGEWERPLADLKRGLVIGGRLTFDSRDPRAREWEKWNRIDSARRIIMPDGSVVEAWVEVTAVQGQAVSFTYHYTFPGGGTAQHCNTAFRTEEQLRSSVHSAGF